MDRDIAFGVIICMLFISLVILFCVLIIKLFIKKIKEHNLKEIEFQKTLNKTILETQEQVFENISQDLHDDIGQQLTFVNLQLEKIKLDNSELVELQNLSSSILKVSRSVRELSHSMNSNLVLQNDLEKAIKSEVNRLKKHSDIDLVFDYHITDYRFSNTEKIILYRIFQEVISNCLKHADATEIKITISQNPTICLSIIDNGKGFDVTKKQTSNSLGLYNIKLRCEMIKYDFELISKINQGTSLLLTKKPIQNE